MMATTPATTHTTPLRRDLRNKLEKTVQAAREISEKAARAVLEQYAVPEPQPWPHLNEQERELRRRLRARARQLGDQRQPDDRHSIEHLVAECAYEHWHRMLFARFLAENHLLMHPDGVAVSLQECEELAAEEEDAADGWQVAERYAARMLPQIFRPDAAVLQLTLAPEYRRQMETLVEALPAEVFTASDALGWVYQFWQSQRKNQINKAEVKIGADELPAVTQLFTEHYMVEFLLHNTIGAWWAGKVLAGDPKLARQAVDEDALRRACSLPGCEWSYLRFIKVAEPSRLGSTETPSRLGPEDANADIPRRDAAATAAAFGFLDKERPIANLKGNLPHWRQEGVTYFVTFRTADSLPEEKWQQWLKERQAWLARHPEPHDEATRHEYYRLFPARIERWLDAGYGECVLELPEVRELVDGALRYFEGKRYSLDEYVIMPNHVHVLVTPIAEHQLSDILHSWKSFTSHKIKELPEARVRLERARKRFGWESLHVWQKESFDHILRNPQQLERIREYICANPKRKSVAEPSRLGNTAEPSRLGSQDANADIPRRDAAATLWHPVAGSFPGWPERLAELRILDPCCGSGHFLVAAFNLLVPLRMHEDGLSAREACDAVLRENLYGLELDPRCTEIAAFALALAAWTYPGAGGYRPLPELNLACSGLSVGGSEVDWRRFAGDDLRLRNGMSRLYHLFQDAPLLGSLLDPAQDAAELHIAGFDELQPLLEQALARETQLGGNFAAGELGIAAKGMARAAQVLSGKYHLVVTNVPYLARGKQDDLLKDFCARHYPTAKNDLATVFLQRCLRFCHGGSDVSSQQRTTRRDAAATGTAALVLPQNWLFLTSYKKLRERLLKEETWNLVARLGPGAFDTISGEVVNVILLVLTHAIPEAGQVLHGLEASAPRTAAEKAALLRTAAIQAVAQKAQLGNPDARVVLEENENLKLLNRYANAFQGVSTSDHPRFRRFFWENEVIDKEWTFFQSTVENSVLYGGCEFIVRLKQMIELLEKATFGDGFIERRTASRESGIYLRGQETWGKYGLSVGQMRHLPATLSHGQPFDTNGAVVLPTNPDHLPAIWAFCSSPEYNQAVRRIDQKLNVTNATLVKVPFDLEYWQKVAEEKYPNGLPKPFSNDPTQWIFHGHPCGAVVWDEEKKCTAHGPLRVDNTVLQVAVARLLGYRWPAERRSDVSSPERETDVSSHEDGSKVLSRGDMRHPRRDAASTFELAEEQWQWVRRCESLLEYADDDGIVCIPAVRGEQPAALRLQALLMKAWGDEWHAGTLDRLLAEVGFAGKSLEDWLRDGFFAQHCALFHQRPFIWHIWDGRKDGFHALVNYHKLDRKRLETLTYTYLGDWLRRQEDELKQNKGGAEARLLAAQILQGKLKQILEGEKPYDIFVRWKPLHEQPIGWEPDLNDGVRLNIRPFVEAGVLRKRPKIHWKKDRGKDPENAPWYHLFQGNRINDHHLSLAEKRVGRGNHPLAPSLVKEGEPPPGPLLVKEGESPPGPLLVKEGESPPGPG